MKRRLMKEVLLFAMLMALMASTALAQSGLGKEIREYTRFSGRTSIDAPTDFLYRDDMLMTDARALSSDLAKASMCLADAAYSESTVGKLLDKMGYSTKTYYTGPMTIKDCDKVSYALGYKYVNGYHIYCVPIKGTTKNSEWHSNFHIGTSGNHEGFYLAAQPIIDKLKYEIKGKSNAIV